MNTIKKQYKYFIATLLLLTLGYSDTLIAVTKYISLTIKPKEKRYKLKPHLGEKATHNKHSEIR